MTFSWKMKQNNKLTVTMFSPENFKNREKPQKFTTNTNTPSSSTIQHNKSNTNSNNSFTSFNQQKNPLNSAWEFHSEVPNSSKRQGTPPLKKLISAPGNLQKYSNPQSNNGLGTNINQFYHNSNTLKQQNIKQQQQQQPLMSNHSTIHKTCSRRTYSDNHFLQTQASTPSTLSLVTPITRKNLQRNKRKTKTQRPFLKSTKKLPSASDLFQNNNSTRKTFVPPPLLSTNSESSIFNTPQTQLPSLYAMVSGSPSHSPVHSPMQSPMYSPQTSPNNSCNDSDQEMTDVERQTSKMSIQNLLGPGNSL